MANFKARARALDMLGRQQIRGIPTAISELFKNAHDAYAERVVADYFSRDKLFVLRDDGVGMSEEDFKSRWLVLGTESKVGSATGLKLPRVDEAKEARPILGEKGIGRLAIAVIGPQVLILTRPISKQTGSDGNSEEPAGLTAAFIHWGLFEIPGVDLDEVDVQMQTFRPGLLPSKDDVAQMVEATRQNVHRLTNKMAARHAERLIAELDAFTVDPQRLDTMLRQPTLSGQSHGTHFYILPADRNLEADLRSRGGNNDGSELTKTLIGFSNTLTPGHAEPRIRTYFRHHMIDGTTAELIGEGEFFTPEEFEAADHHIQGQFNEYGQFAGTLKIFDKEPIDLVVPWTEARGRLTECGPFSFNLAVIQGLPKESLLLPDDWKRLHDKISRVGGLYIYRDGIRVLPYGNNDVDFLNIEKRRTMGAAHYFFSYRRMYGAIEISQSTNCNLSEKAGREGFRENTAYREFRSILENLFIQVAAEYFRKDGAFVDTFEERKAELTRAEEIRQKREKKSKASQREIKKLLEAFYKKVEQGQPEIEAKKVQQDFEGTVAGILENKQRNDDAVALALIEAENDAKKRLDEIAKSYQLTRPAGALPPDLRRDYEFYRNERRRIELVFDSASQFVMHAAAEAFEQVGTTSERRLRLEVLVAERNNEAKRQNEEKSRQVRQLVVQKHEQANSLIRQRLTQFIDALNDTMQELASTDLTAFEENELVKLQKDLEDRIASASSSYYSLLENIEAQISSIDLTPDEEGRLSGAREEADVLEEEVLSLQERAETDFELTRLGMAVDVIGHEFSNNVLAIRRSLQGMKGWAQSNPGLRPLYTNLRTNFEHLDSYLTLLTPIQRRLHRTKVVITGAEFAGYIETMFKEQLEEHDIKLTPTPTFLAKDVLSYPSTFYPVFINLIDNAVFWLKDTIGRREIILDADKTAFIVSDSGRGIAARDAETVFERGFSRKPGGRGLGLFIAHEGLKKEGFRLSLSKSGPLSGATFRIEKMEVADKDEQEPGVL